MKSNPSRNRDSSNNLILYNSSGRNHLTWDTTPEFAIISYSYDKSPSLSFIDPMFHVHHYALTSFALGDSFYQLIKRIRLDSYDLVGFLSEDVSTNVSDINKLFKIAKKRSLTLFQPSLSYQSYSSHLFTLNNRHYSSPRECPWVEFIFPFFSSEILQEIAMYPIYSVSSWGVDSILLPFLNTKIHNSKPYIIDQVQVTHLDPIKSGNKPYPSGVSAMDEEFNTFKLISQNYNYPELWLIATSRYGIKSKLAFIYRYLKNLRLFFQ